MAESSESKFTQGVKIASQDQDFREGLRAAVDYRGDVTIELKTGDYLEGFLFNLNGERLDVFPKNSPQKKSIGLEDVESIEFSGEDEAAGKSWEEWVKKRDKLREANDFPSLESNP